MPNNVNKFETEYNEILLGGIVPSLERLFCVEITCVDKSSNFRYKVLGMLLSLS
jgi:hypothetical protein